MGKQLITAADVQRAEGTLVVAPDAIITALARDAAAERGVQIQTSGSQPAATRSVAGSAPAAETVAGAGDSRLTAAVSELVSKLVQGGGQQASSHRQPPVKHVAISSAQLEKFGHPGPAPDMQVRTGDVVTDADGAPMAAGYMTLTKGSFPWHFDYDEIQIVLEGELHLGGDAGGKIGRPGDIFYIPKGTNLTFGTPNWTKFVYVTFPANWEG